MGTAESGLLAQIESEDWRVRCRALDGIKEEDVPLLSGEAWRLIPLLQEPQPQVCCSAVRAMGKLPPERLAFYAAELLRCFEHSDPEVRLMAREVSQKLPQEQVMRFLANIFIKNLGSEDLEVKQLALESLIELKSEVLGDVLKERLELLAPLLQGEVPLSCRALQLLGRLPPDDWCPRYLTTIKELQGHESEEIWGAARTVLQTLPQRYLVRFLWSEPTALVEHLKYLAPSQLAEVANLRSDVEPYQTVLHFVARSGNAELCTALLVNGALPNWADSTGQTPLDVANALGHRAVAKALEKGQTLRNNRAGLGDAHARARADNRCVTKVQWYSIPMNGRAGALGARHCLLQVTVTNPQEGDRECYVIEKAEPQTSVTSGLGPYGVYISMWEDTKLNVPGPAQRVLAGNEVKAKVKMADLEALAAAKDYDIGHYNSSHAALQLWNHCCSQLAAHEMLEKLPENKWNSRVARGLQKVGLGCVLTGRGSQS